MTPRRAWLDDDHDLAAIELRQQAVEGRDALPLKVDAPPVGADILVPGFGLGTELVFCDDLLGVGSAKSITPVLTKGSVAARIPDDGRQVQLVAYDCTTFAGQSGSPTVGLESREVIGVHTASVDSRFGYCVPAHFISDLLIRVNAQSVRPHAAPAEEGTIEFRPAEVDLQGARQIEKDIKFRGEVWRILRNDADPFPSNPHAHLKGSRYKLHLGTGQLFHRNTAIESGLKAKHLKELRKRAEAAGLEMPPLEI